MAHKCADFKIGDKVSFDETVITRGTGVVEYVSGSVNCDFVNVKLEGNDKSVTFNFRDNTVSGGGKGNQPGISISSLKKSLPEVQPGDLYKVSGTIYAAVKRHYSGDVVMVCTNSLLSTYTIEDFFKVAGSLVPMKVYPV